MGPGKGGRREDGVHRQQGNAEKQPSNVFFLKHFLKTLHLQRPNMKVKWVNW